MKKLLLTLLVLLPLTVTAVPVTIERTVVGFNWDTLVNGDGVVIRCNEIVVGETIDPTDTELLVGELSLTANDTQSCTLTAYIDYSNVGRIESAETAPLTFFTVGGVAKVSITVEAPDAPSNFNIILGI